MKRASIHTSSSKLNYHNCFLSLSSSLSPDCLTRDLKLDNVLIDREGHIRVGDFGLSTFMKTEESRNACCGTIYYLAPEVTHINN